MKTTDIKLFAMEYIDLQDNINSDDKMTMMQFVTESDITTVKSFLLTGQMRSLEEGESEFVNVLFEAPNVHDISNLYKHPFSGSVTSNLSNLAKRGVTLAKGAAKSAKGKAFIPKLQGEKALGDSSAIKALASKWASFKVPSAKTLGNKTTVGFGDNAAAWGKHYNTAIKAINKGAPVAGIVVAAMVVMLARKAYKAYFTKAAKACKGKKGVEKNECIRIFKKKAMEQEISVLNSSKKACEGASNPDKCVLKINTKILAKKKAIQKVMTSKKPR